MSKQSPDAIQRSIIRRVVDESPVLGFGGAELLLAITRPVWDAATRHATRTNGAEVASLRHAALFAAGVRGGPGAWRWASDPAGTILDDVAAWERLLGEMRATSEKAAPPEPRKPPVDRTTWCMCKHTQENHGGAKHRGRCCIVGCPCFRFCWGPTPAPQKPISTEWRY